MFFSDQMIAQCEEASASASGYSLLMQTLRLRPMKWKVNFTTLGEDAISDRNDVNTADSGVWVCRTGRNRSGPVYWCRFAGRRGETDA